jgi:hypothetical protein
MLPTEIKKTKRKLLRAIRGPKSQVQLSRRLGFDFNQIYRWEAGLTRIHWQEFIQLCGICKVDLKKPLKEAVSFHGSLEKSVDLVRHLIGTQKITLLAKSIKISRFTLADWTKGKSDPTLDGILQLLASRDLLQNFLEAISGADGQSPLETPVLSKKAARTYFYENPLATAVAMCLDLSDYRKLKKHDPDFICQQIGISATEEKRIISQMEELRIIVKVDGRFQRCEQGFNSRGEFEGERDLRRFWVERGLQVDQARHEPNDKNYFGFLIFPVDKKRRAQAMEAYVQFANALYNISQEDLAEGDQLMATTIQMFGLNEIFKKEKS